MLPLFSLSAETQEDSPDEVVFGKPAESCEEFVDCFDMSLYSVIVLIISLLIMISSLLMIFIIDDAINDTEIKAVLDALNYALERDGFMSITP